MRANVHSTYVHAYTYTYTHSQKEKSRNGKDVSRNFSGPTIVPCGTRATQQVQHPCATTKKGVWGWIKHPTPHPQLHTHALASEREGGGGGGFPPRSRIRPNNAWRGLRAEKEEIETAKGEGRAVYPPSLPPQWGKGGGVSRKTREFRLFWVFPKFAVVEWTEKEEKGHDAHRVGNVNPSP